MYGGNERIEPWTAEREAQLMQMWEHEGLSARDIASRLGGTTRNAVIGKVRRMKLSFRNNAGWKSPRSKAQRGVQRPPRHLQRARISPRRAFLVAKHPPAPELIVAPIDRRKLTDLEAGDCRHPIGDPQHEDFGFCNQLQVGTATRDRPGIMPYCEAHARLNYVPAIYPPTMSSIARTPWNMGAGSNPKVIREQQRNFAEFDKLEIA